VQNSNYTKFITFIGNLQGKYKTLFIEIINIENLLATGRKQEKTRRNRKARQEQMPE
jgi:hypothetical protein